MSLVINQTPEVQKQIAALLSNLRRLQDQEIALEIRILTVPEDICERIGIEFGSVNEQPRKIDTAEQIKWLNDAANPSKAKFLNDAQVLSLMEAVQGDTRTHITQAPKLTLFNAQTGGVSGVCGQDRRFPIRCSACYFSRPALTSAESESRSDRRPALEHLS